MDPDQTALGSTLFHSMPNWSVILSNYLQQTTFSDAFFLGALRVNWLSKLGSIITSSLNCGRAGPSEPSLVAIQYVLFSH